MGQRRNNDINQIILIDKRKIKHRPKFMGCSKGSGQKGIYSYTCLHQERSQSNNLSCPLKKWGKEQQSKEKGYNKYQTKNQ